MDLAGAAVEEHRGVECEDFREFAGELLGEGLHGIDEQDGAAEGVQALDVLLALDGVEGSALGFADSRLAMRAVARKLNSATQFCGSAMVNVPTGGKKKKLKVRVAAMEASVASAKSPGAGDQQHQQQVGEADGGGIVWNYGNSRWL